MIHHFPGSIPPDYHGSLIFFKEAFRILKDKGVLVINTVSKEQAEKGWWVLHIIPAISERHKARYVKHTELKKNICLCGGRFLKNVFNCYSEQNYAYNLFLMNNYVYYCYIYSSGKYCNAKILILNNSVGYNFGSLQSYLY